MCGIAGFTHSDKVLIKAMTDAIAHRGPDGEGHFIDSNISLGHRRLSIIDLSSNGNQPMFFEEWVIVFNGEIYNYVQIKQELMAIGHVFVTDSDTEVILHAYKQWGHKALDRFNGMWAFAIYNKQSAELFIARDRYGVKPLYYGIIAGSLFFASEMKAIMCAKPQTSLSMEALNLYLYQKYIGQEHTVYKEFKKLLPGHYMLYNCKSKTLEIQAYYSLEAEVEEASKIDLKARLKTIETLLEDAVMCRLVADVKVGSFLSGGVDSSVISAIIAEKKDNFDTFSIGFKETGFDELPYSIQVAEHIKTQHHFEYNTLDFDLIKTVIAQLDEPFGDASIIPTYLLARLTRKHVTVSLSGDAGDEVFGGYASYLAYHISQYLPSWVFGAAKKVVGFIPSDHKKLSTLFKLKKAIVDYEKNPVLRHLNWMSQWNDKQRQALLGQRFIANTSLYNIGTQGGLQAIQLNDMHHYLAEDILKKVDAATMMNSLEGRNPFLDFRLVPLVISLPHRYKIKGLKTKVYLKEMAQKYIPTTIINRKKRGFSVPIAQWIKAEPEIKRYLLDEEFNGHNLFNKTLVQEMFAQHINNKADHSRPLWLIFVFNFWLSKNPSNNPLKQQHAI